MGYRFSLQHANIVSYVVGQSSDLPRIQANDLRDFLYSLEGSRLISTSEQWRTRIGSIARDGIYALENTPQGESSLAGSQLDRILRPLRSIFSTFDVIALSLNSNTSERGWEFSRYIEGLARNTSESLFLMPEEEIREKALEVFDPSKEIREIVERQNEWPGLLLWYKTYSPEDKSAVRKFVFIPFKILLEMYNPFIHRSRPDANLTLRDIPEKLHEHTKRDVSPQRKALLHLSDLHFGTKQALRNVPYLLAEIARIKNRFSRVVVSGDLFDNPKPELAEQFRGFFEQIRIFTGTKPIIIPGNHDQKWFGNFVPTAQQLSELRWDNLIIDDDLRCVFFCFDSSKDANLARGKITKEQLMRVSTSYAAELVNKPHIESYLRISVIHHHPYPFKLKAETLVQKILKRLKIDEETFLRMDEADRFLGWCARRGVPLILHGHKHVQRHVIDSIPVGSSDGGRSYEVTAIGCGTSLGAEDYPLSYNIIEWDSQERRWMSQFFSDPGDGSGFQSQLITVHRPGNTLNLVDTLDDQTS